MKKQSNFIQNIINEALWLWTTLIIGIGLGVGIAIIIYGFQESENIATVIGIIIMLVIFLISEIMYRLNWFDKIINIVFKAIKDLSRKWHMSFPNQLKDDAFLEVPLSIDLRNAKTGNKIFSNWNLADLVPYISKSVIGDVDTIIKRATLVDIWKTIDSPRPQRADPSIINLSQLAPGGLYSLIIDIENINPRANYKYVSLYTYLEMNKKRELMKFREIGEIKILYLDNNIPTQNLINKLNISELTKHVENIVNIYILIINLIISEIKIKKIK